MAKHDDVPTWKITALKGMNLLGFMGLERADWPRGHWDNAIALYVGTAKNPECFVLRTENQDYSRYDVWVLEKAARLIPRDHRYKAIGERIIEVANTSDTEPVKKSWTEDVDTFWLSIRTKTKTIRCGHHWHDCHYPEGIWGVL